MASRKDRLVQTRVPKDLEGRLKKEAGRQRISVSQFVRNVIEDSLDLVDDVLDSVDEIVHDSVEFAEQMGRDARRVAGSAKRGGHHVAKAARRDARRLAGAARESGAQDVWKKLVEEAQAATRAAGSGGTGSDQAGGVLADVDAWNPVILNRSAVCERCGDEMRRGDRGYVGLSEKSGTPMAWLCDGCIGELR